MYIHIYVYTHRGIAIYKEKVFIQKGMIRFRL